MQVLQASYDAQKAMLPFMEHRALRRIVQTFTNDENQDFGKWAMNPMVIQMLTQARDMLDSGQLSELDVEQALTAQLQVGDLCKCLPGCVAYMLTLRTAGRKRRGSSRPGGAAAQDLSFCGAAGRRVE